MSEEVEILDENGEVIEKKEEIKLTEAEKEQIEHQRNVFDRLINNDTAYKFGVLIDNSYRNYCAAESKLRTAVYSIFILKKRLDQNRVEIEKGETEQKFGDGRVKQIDDLKIDNLNLALAIDDAIDNIQMLFVQMYKYVDVPRIDKQVFLTNEKYNGIVEKYVNLLREKNIDVFRER